MELMVSTLIKNSTILFRLFLDEHNENEDEKPQNSSANICQSHLVDSALPTPNNKQQRILELQKLKANCKPETLQKIKTKCEILVRDCIAGLLIQLSIKDFKEVEGKLGNFVKMLISGIFH